MERRSPTSNQGRRSPCLASLMLESGLSVARPAWRWGAVRRTVPLRFAPSSKLPVRVPAERVARRAPLRHCSEGERGAVAPLSHFPPGHAGSERSSLPFVCCALGSTPTAQNHGDNGAPASSPGGGLRPASRGSAKPAPTTPPPANLTAANGASPYNALRAKTMQFPKPPPEFSVSSGSPVVRWGACESSAG